MKLRCAGILFLLALLVVVIWLFLFHKHTALLYSDFDESMQLKKYKHIVDRTQGWQIYNILKKLYEHNNFLHVKPRASFKIPPIIHQIWIQGNPPEHLLYTQKSWKKFHPSWKYMLWTDQEIQKLRFLPRDLYIKARNYGEKADIARYAILYEYGGVYADFDQECLKNCDDLHYCYDFYIGIQPLDTNAVQLGIGIIGSTKQHPLLKCILDALYTRQHIPQIIAKTGPVFFTHVFCSVIFKMPGINIALPARYFYPRGYTESENTLVWLKPESFAVHHWAGTWLKQEAFVK